MNAKVPSCSIILPVLREASLINGVIDHLRSLENNKETEIIVVDGEPEGTTLTAIARDNVTRLRAPRGRGKQMNAGAREAKGRMLLFLHADTELPLKALRLISAAMQDKRYVAGAFDLGIRSEKFIFRLIESAASLRSRATRIPFGDQAIFVRKDYFDKIGGYQDIPIMEDVEIMKRIRKRGDKIVILHQRVHTSSRRWEKEGILRCTLRNWLLQVLYLLGVSPHRFSKLYGHKQ
ncbi:MAG: TIGR04283 family arsenosugar biosynthesis glycosyltransferase [Syntrophorhabdaceae bacterium]|nr:TIGR04283 family arsenosugar biosynthesis glycosyltransferase [Syntrophorhabdaceae bacterium]